MKVKLQSLKIGWKGKKTFLGQAIFHAYHPKNDDIAFLRVRGVVLQFSTYMFRRDCNYISSCFYRLLFFLFVIILFSLFMNYDMIHGDNLSAPRGQFVTYILRTCVSKASNLIAQIRSNLESEILNVLNS